MRLKIKILTAIFTLLVVQNIKAYPQFVGLGYTSCITCHYNPSGNGPLNDYGRAIGSTGVAADWFYSAEDTEEDIVSRSGFFFNKPDTNSWIKPSFDYRGLFFQNNYGKDTQDNEFINMMADFNIVIKSKDNKFFLSYTIGYAPVRENLEQSGIDYDKYRVREAYAGYRLSPDFGLYLGLNDKIYGIRIAEHSNYSRAVNNLSQNDQSLGLQFHYSKPSFEVSGGYFVGNPVQDEKLRQKGFSVKADYVVAHKASVGVSVLSSKNEYLKQFMSAFHVKSAVGKGSAVLLEVGQVKKQSVSGAKESSEFYGYGQSYLNIMRGVYLINSLEFYQNSNKDLNMKAGPGIQIFPSQKLEFRFEVYNTRVISSDQSTEDKWDLLSQIHVWF